MRKKWRAWICLFAASMLFVSACSSGTDTVPVAESSASVETAEAAEKSLEETEVLQSTPVDTEEAEETVTESVDAGSVSDSTEVISEEGKEALLEAAKEYLAEHDTSELLHDAYGWVKILNDASIQLEGADVEIKLGTVLMDIIRGDITTDVDLTQMVDALSLTENVVIHAGDQTIVVTLVNPYNEPIEIGKALVASISYSIEDGASSDLAINDLPISRMTREEFLEYFPAVYESDDHTLVYRYYVPEIHQVVGPETSENGALLLDTHGYAELILDFGDAGTPKTVTLNAPWLLYFGLQDTFEEEEIEAMTPVEVIDAIDLRNEIVSELIDALERTTLDFEIDRSTGTVSLNNAVLFAQDEYRLTDEGRDFIDTFIKVFSAVLMQNEYKYYVTEIVYEGNTDTDNTYEYNLKLSQRRAESVMDYSINSDSNGLNDEERAFLEDRSRAVGYSYSNPIFNEDGSVNMAASRRVDIRFRLQVGPK